MSLEANKTTIYSIFHPLTSQVKQVPSLVFPDLSDNVEIKINLHRCKPIVMV